MDKLASIKRRRGTR